MALRLYGGTAADFLADPAGNVVPGGPYSVFTDRALTNNITPDVTDHNGDAFTDDQPVANAAGIVEFTVDETHRGPLYVVTYDETTDAWRTPVAVNPTDIAQLAVDIGGGVGAAPDATTTSKGVVQLAGDLAGTASAPLLADPPVNLTVLFENALA